MRKTKITRSYYYKRWIQIFLRLGCCSWLLIWTSNVHAQPFAQREVPRRLTWFTGIATLDLSLLEEQRQLGEVFETRPRVFILHGEGTKYAHAVCPSRPSENDGLIALGMSLLAQELWSKEKGPGSVVGVLAHEWAHILQCAMGSQFSDKQRELHADYITGYYFARRGGWLAADFPRLIRNLFENGHEAFCNPQFQGRAEERTAALMAGFSQSALPALRAYQAGEVFVVNPAGKTVPPGTRMVLSYSRSEAMKVAFLRPF